MKENLGFIGLGIMGRPIVLNLLRSGYNVSVWARRQDAANAVAQHGAQVCDSPRHVAESSEVIMLCVSDTEDVERLIFDDNGLLNGLRPGNVVIDMSTISPEATQKIARRLADRDVDMLDAPVSGGEQGAIDGTLSIMVGGKTDVVERIRPIFEVIGGNIAHIGEHGAGQVAKACNQLLVAQTLIAVAEALLLAEACSVDPQRVREALLGGLAYSKILENHGQRMLDKNFNPGFRARLHKKDLCIVMETAQQLGIGLTGTAVASQLMNALVGRGNGDLDSSSIIEEVRKHAGAPVAENKP